MCDIGGRTSYSRDKIGVKDIETIKISYDNTNAEVEQAYKRFLHKYTFKRSVIFSIVYLIAAGLGLNLMITAPSQIYGYLVFVIGLGMLFSVWARPYYARKKLIRTLESFSRETYTAEFRKESIEIQTIILPDEEMETVAVTPYGVMKVGEDVEIPEEKVIEQPEKTVISLAENTLDSDETDELFMLYLNRSLIYIFPKRCLTDEEKTALAAYFDDKNI